MPSSWENRHCTSLCRCLRALQPSENVTPDHIPQKFAQPPGYEKLESRRESMPGWHACTQGWRQAWDLCFSNSNLWIKQVKVLGLYSHQLLLCKWHFHSFHSTLVEQATSFSTLTGLVENSLLSIQPSFRFRKYFPPSFRDITCLSGWGQWFYFFFKLKFSKLHHLNYPLGFRRCGGFLG